MAGSSYRWLALTVVVIIAVWLCILPRRWPSPFAAGASAYTQLLHFRSALNQYVSDYGAPPRAEQGLNALLRKRPLNRGSSSYLHDVTVIPNDPWGLPYRYRLTNVNGKLYTVETFGKDGRQGGTGENADIRVSNLPSSEVR